MQSKWLLPLTTQYREREKKKRDGIGLEINTLWNSR